MLVKSGLKAAPHNSYFFPLFIADLSEKLTASKRADCNNKPCGPDLICQTNETGLVEFLRTVGCEAPRWPAQRVGQHRDFSGVGTKMRMKMLRVFGSQQKIDQARLNQINKVDRKRSFCPSPKLPYRRQGLNHVNWSRC